MKFYNEYDIQIAAQAYSRHPVLSRAVDVLATVKADADDNSDGWHSWMAPCKACQKLIELIESGDATEAQYRKAIAPIKAFYTRVNSSVYGPTNYPKFPAY